MVSKRKAAPFAIAVLILAPLVAAGGAQAPQTPTKAVQLTGLAGVSKNTKGSLTVENGALRFAHSGKSFDLPQTSMRDVITGDDSQRVVRGTIGTLSMFCLLYTSRCV